MQIKVAIVTNGVGQLGDTTKYVAILMVPEGLDPKGFGIDWHIGNVIVDDTVAVATDNAFDVHTLSIPVPTTVMDSGDLGPALKEALAAKPFRDGASTL